MKLCSVITPTFNRESVLGRTLESVFAQKYRPVELIVVDDGSEDHTAELVTDFKQRYSEAGFEIKYHKQKHSGQSTARNAGIGLSSGEYIIFLDSDDELYPDGLRHAIEEAERTPGWEIVQCPYRIVLVDQGGRSFDRLLSKESSGLWRDPCVRIRDFHVWVGASIYARDFLLRVGPWREDLLVYEDAEFNVRAAILCNPERIVFGSHLAMQYNESQRLNNVSNNRSSVANIRTIDAIEEVLCKHGFSRLQRISIMQPTIIGLLSMRADLDRALLKRSYSLVSSRNARMKILVLLAYRSCFGSYKLEVLRRFLFKTFPTLLKRIGLKRQKEAAH